MFTIFSTLRSSPMDENDRNALVDMLQTALKDSVFQWLREIPLNRISFRFCPAFQKDDSTMGAFSMLRPLTVFLRDHPARSRTPPGGRSVWIELMFPIIVHELRHLWQFRKHPLLFILCSIPGLRVLTFERDAELRQHAAAVVAQRYMALRDRADFGARFNKQHNP